MINKFYTESSESEKIVKHRKSIASIISTADNKERALQFFNEGNLLSQKTFKKSGLQTFEDEVKKKKWFKVKRVWKVITNILGVKKSTPEQDFEKTSVDNTVLLESTSSNTYIFEPGLELKNSFELYVNTIERNVPYFDIYCASQYAGRVYFKLYDNVCPITCENFRRLCKGKEKNLSCTDTPLCYRGTKIFRIIPRFVIQGGDIHFNDGSGGECVYAHEKRGGSFSRFFDDENYIIKHHTCGMLAMANCGPNTNQSQFYITCAPLPWLDGRGVIFGKGQEIFAFIEKLGSDSGKTSVDVFIKDCGVLSVFHLSTPDPTTNQSMNVKLDSEEL